MSIPPRYSPRRDRHGRGIRGPLMPPSLRAWRTRQDIFDDQVSSEMTQYRKLYPNELAPYDIAILDVPLYDPAPWEEGVPLSRILPFEKPSKLHGRIVFYRRVILASASTRAELTATIHEIVTEHVAHILGRFPEEIDYLRHS